ncbi:hypothetical protein BHE74_00034109 [Ensete ventricosum]|nr:hypothetical protein BHE74_00034109 [Ensete ventricosum]
MMCRWDTPIHVDAASGGFIAPFLYPELEWDFRLPLVKSINVSGHKYGLVYAGVEGFISRSGFWQGFRNIMENCMENAKVLKAGIEGTETFDIVSKDVGVPLVAFSLKDSAKYTVFDVSESLRRFGWIVPSYTMPADAEHVAVLRVVIREDFSRSLAERLVTDINKVLTELENRWTKTTMVAHVKPEDKPDGVGAVVLKKTVKQTHEDIARYWKRLVDRKKTSGVC